MRLPPALLEDWMRGAYHRADFDIGSSGVQCFRLGEILQRTNFSAESLEQLLLEDGETYGMNDLRNVIAARYGDGKADSVMVTHGSSEAIFLIMHSLLSPGDDVVVVDPCYQQLRAVAESVGCQMNCWPLRFEDQYVPDVAVFKRLISDRTRMVILNFPHNPTGCSLEQSQYDELISHIAKTGAYLIWDAAFAEMNYGKKLSSPLGNYERAIELGTLSKAFGLPGLRVGWCIANPDILMQLARLRDYVTLFLSPLVEMLACVALRHGDTLVEERMTQNRHNLQLLTEWMNRHAKLVSWVRPSGGVTAFPRIELEVSVDALCRELVEQYRVLLVPGSCFGHERHVRLGFGGSSEELSVGLTHLSTALHARI